MTKAQKTGFHLQSAIFFTWMLSVFLVPSLAAAANVNASDTETPGILHAKDFFPKSLLTAADYVIEDTVVSDGARNTYAVVTDKGKKHIYGDESLYRFIRETLAVSAMRSVMDQPGFREAADTCPEFLHASDTASGEPKWMQQVGFSANEKGIWLSFENKTMREFFSAFYERKKQLTYQLGTDPDTVNPVLQKTCNQLLFLLFCKNRNTEDILPLIYKPVLEKISSMRPVDRGARMIRENPLAELISTNEKRLKDMGVRKKDLSSFMTNQHYTTSMRTRMVQNLFETDAKKRRIFFHHAASAASPEEAWGFHDLSAVFRKYHVNITYIREFMDLEGTIACITRKKVFLLPFVFDHVFWTKDFSNYFTYTTKDIDRDDFLSVEIWVTGSLSPLARKQMHSMGMKVYENVFSR